MYNQVIFYNHFGAGDVFESREFVKAWMELVPANAYFYSHGKSENILLDIPSIQFKSITQHMKVMNGVWDDSNGNLYVNTWIGRDGKYVLPGIGCTVEKLYDMHNDLLSVYGLGTLPWSPVSYIPSIDYSKYNIQKAKKFLKENSQDKVFIDNGIVQSNQAFNFPFEDIIKDVAEMYTDKLFITSQPTKLQNSNVHSAESIIGSKGSGFDLNEISFVSTFCSTLIGRNSGPHVYTQVKENCFSNKKLLSFTYEQQGSSFIVNTDVTIKKYWSPATDKQGVINKIVEVLNV